MAKTLAIIAVIVIAVALSVPRLRDKSVSNLPLEEKMELAESYLQELQQEGNAFFAKMQKLEASPKDFASEAGGFNKILKKYTKSINGLHLPCPTSSETRNDPNLSSYISWAESFEAKDRRIMEGFQKQLNQISERAGFSRG